MRLSTVDEEYLAAHGRKAVFEKLPPPLKDYDDALFRWFVFNDFACRTSPKGVTYRDYALAVHRRNGGTEHPPGPVISFHPLESAARDIASAEILIQRVEPTGWLIEFMNPNYDGTILKSLRNDFLTEKVKLIV
jgi:hypothetical protein